MNYRIKKVYSIWIAALTIVIFPFEIALIGKHVHTCRFLFQHLLVDEYFEQICDVLYGIVQRLVRYEPFVLDRIVTFLTQVVQSSNSQVRIELKRKFWIYRIAKQMRIARCVRHNIVFVQNAQTQVAIKAGFFRVFRAEFLDFLNTFLKKRDTRMSNVLWSPRETV